MDISLNQKNNSIKSFDNLSYRLILLQIGLQIVFYLHE